MRRGRRNWYCAQCGKTFPREQSTVSLGQPGHFTFELCSEQCEQSLCVEVALIYPGYRITESYGLAIDAEFRNGPMHHKLHSRKSGAYKNVTRTNLVVYVQYIRYTRVEGVRWDWPAHGIVRRRA